MRWLKMMGLLAAFCLLGGCAGEETSQTQIANPWQNYETLQTAEKAAGFALGIEETIDGWQAAEYRVMNASLLEVIYQKDGRTVCLRKAKGSEDISGDYNTYDNVTVVEYPDASVTQRDDKGMLVFADPYCWSVYCDDGFEEGQAEGFLTAILKA
ncbi:MAG: hypothetical protein IKU72_03465 [Oscillospiraceae bacterium]|nr:hypothetical protein [Oscillospiraceae bacterium]